MRTSEIITIKDPKSPVSEAYRTLRTNIQFSSLDNKIQTILITSSGPSEGKTTTSTNLGVTLAEGGKKTIIIDCDQRKPKVHKLLGLSNQVGLSNLLIGEVTFDAAAFLTGIDNLYVLPAGTKPPNPSELLSSEKMHKFIDSLKGKFDYIILDTPPVIMVTDAQILSKYADGCILVVASGEANKDAVKKAKELLEKVKAKLIGVVINKVDTTTSGYYGRYYDSYYGNEDKAKKRKSKGVISKILGIR